MLKALLLLVAFFASQMPVLGAESQKPPQTANGIRPPVAKENAVEAKKSDEGNAEFNKGRTIAPDIAPGATKSAPLYTETRCEHGCGHDEDEKSWLQKLRTDPNADFAGAVALLTLGLVLVGSIQGYLTNRQINLARDEFLSTHRPKIHVRNMRVVEPGVDDNGERVEEREIRFLYFNIGNSDATNIQVFATAYMAKIDERVSPQNPTWIACTTDKRSLKAGEFGRASSKGHHRIDDFGVGFAEAATQINNVEKSTIYCVGTITYNDPLGHERRMGFARRYDFALRRFDALANDEEYEYNY